MHTILRERGTEPTVPTCTEVTPRFDAQRVILDRDNTMPIILPSRPNTNKLTIKGKHAPHEELAIQLKTATILGSLRNRSHLKHEARQPRTCTVLPLEANTKTTRPVDSHSLDPVRGLTPPHRLVRGLGPR